MDSNPVELEEEEEEEQALFVESNLGTHLAISVPPDFTVALLKGKLAYEHFICFPDFGEIKVQKVMVKQKSVLYQLPDSMVIKCAFQGLSNSWFIHMEATNSLRTKAVTETRDFTSDIEEGRDQYAAGEGLKENVVDKVATSAKGSNLSESLFGLNLNKDETTNSLKMKAVTQTRDLAADVQKGRDQYAAGEGLKESAVDKVATSAKGPDLSESLSGLNLNNDEAMNSRKMKTVMETRDLVSDVEKGRNQYAAGEALKESAVDKMATSAKAPNLSVSLSGLNLDKDEHSSEETRKDDNNPKFEVSDRNGMHVTEETSVAGIISRYFCESDEMSSCSCRPESATKSNKSTKARKRSNDEDVCSSNVANLNAEQSKQGSLRVKKRSDILRKRKKFSSSVVMNKHKTKRNGAMVNSKPTSTRRMSSLRSPFGKHMDAVNRVRDTSEVGKRLVQAANNIGLSANPSQSPISLLVQKRARSISSKSAPSVRHLAFEIDDNEVEEHI
ncbi:hypothetical protein DsansV1_C22g0170191 [Dioscorea sansibarensis]